MKARIVVTPRREILDPQGKAICGALARLGFTGVEEVRAGKSFDIEFAADDAGDARRQLSAMCERLLVNPVVEDFEIVLEAPSEARA